MDCGRFTEKDEHPPVMQSAMGLCKHGYINQIIKFASHQFQGIAGRSNVQHRMMNKKPELLTPYPMPNAFTEERK